MLFTIRNPYNGETTMGYYINPPGQSKEDWLSYSTKLDAPPRQHVDGQGNVAVCLVYNGSFSAAAVAWCQEELEAFQSPVDPRRKDWYMVAIADLPIVTGRTKEFWDETLS